MKNKPKFIRYGKPTTIKQKGFDPEMPSFHSPPSKKGFYAFVDGFVELFLLTGDSREYGGQYSKWEAVKDLAGRRIELNPDIYENLSEVENFELCPFFAHYDGKSDIDAWMFRQIKKLTGKPITQMRIQKRGAHYYLVKRIRPTKFKHTGEIWHHLDPHKVNGCTAIEIRGDWFKTTYSDFCLLFQKNIGRFTKNWVSHPLSMKNCTYSCSYDELEVFIEKLSN